MSGRWNLIIDVAECHNCSNCVLSARDEFSDNHFANYTAPHPRTGPTVIQIERKVRGNGHHTDVAYRPNLCQHCDDGPCLKAGVDGAVKKRADGIVLFDPEKARGRRDLVDVCPYGAVVWNEEQQLPQTWFFDAHLLDEGWKEPRAVTACPTRAMQAVRCTDEDMKVRAKAQGLRALRPELGTQPRVHYRNLGRFDRHFVAGTVVASVQGCMDCVQGAEVSLVKDGQFIQKCETTAFGDFRFDGLEAGSGVLMVQVSHPQWGSCVQKVDLTNTSVVLGDLLLS